MARGRSTGELAAWLGPLTIDVLPIAHDCTDGFLGAYWRRPSAWLDPAVRGAISAVTRIGDVEPRIERLRRDLGDGNWMRRHGHLLERQQVDLGYRLVVAHVPRRGRATS